MNCSKDSVSDSGVISLGVKLNGMQRALKFKVHFCDECIVNADEFMGEGLSDLAGVLSSAEAGSELLSDTGVTAYEM